MDISTYQLIHKSDFRKLWADMNKKLNQRDINNVRQQIDTLQTKGKTESAIINNLQKRPKLKDRYEAERAYETEKKRLETLRTKELGEKRGLNKFYIILEPNACSLCKKMTENGRRFFTAKQIGDGNKTVVPFHPNCHCHLIPVI
jgi:hypothetical protein